ncbi:MAG: aconitate hydratase [Thermodesulfobacteriota bacterium]
MGQNLVQKIIAGHLAEGEMIPGREIGLRIDNVLMHDATGQMALLQFEALGLPRAKSKRAVVYTDHNILQVGFENMDDHHFLASASRKFGLYYSRAGNGICHQVNLERFSVPGETLLGADSHTTTAGAAGMLAIGAGGLDIAVAMAEKPFYLAMPKVLRVNLTGVLPAWSSAKDVALEVLRRLTVSGGRGKVLEFTGPGLDTLSTTQRATIANMSIECGAFTAIFPSDETTRRYFAAQERESDWRELSADAGAVYDEEMTIDLSRIEPLAARPHSPDNVTPVREAAGLAVHQVAIGSCTNSSLEDMLKVAAILRGRLVPPGVSLVVAPGSRQVLLDLEKMGALRDILSAGARLVETACGFCNGVGQAPRSGGVSVRTSNRNFPGRSGTADAELYLVSPETAAVTAINGRLTDPRSFGEAVTVSLPEKFTIDDRLFVPPAGAGEEVEIIRGPNIAPLPRFSALPDELEGELFLVLGDNVTTDDILPAGAHILSKRANIPVISRYVFTNIDPGFSERVRSAGTGFIAGGRNYGQGSSREHAALAPRYLGIRAVMAVSFARIHKANLVNFGILPLELNDPADISGLAQGDRLRLTGLRASLKEGRPIEVENLTRKTTLITKLDVSTRAREVLLSGGTLAHATSAGSGG